MFEFRPHQIEAVEAVDDAFRSGIERPLLDVCVGGGKSIIFGEMARREIERGGRVLTLADRRELVEQNAGAARMLGVRTGINAASLGERTWRAPLISAAIQSIFRDARSLGQITLVCADESHLWPHSEAGMYRQLMRDLGNPRVVGASGTIFRLQGGSLVEGEDAPFQKVVYTYPIIDGINDGYLVSAFSATIDDKIDLTKLRTLNGEFTGASQDTQNLEMLDSHISQMVYHGEKRGFWLIFEASTKAAKAMTARLNQWGIRTGLVLGETPASERAATIAAYKAGRLRCLVNVAALTTGFDVQSVDMLVMRRATKSLGLYIQIIGRCLRTIGGNIESSIAAGKSDALVLDFAGNIDRHGPLDDVIQPKETKHRLVSCELCAARNSPAAARCWACDELMTKLCPACVKPVNKGTLDCPYCEYDMRTGGGEGEEKPQKLLEKSSGAALISAFAKIAPRAGGWIPIRKVWKGEGFTFLDANGDRWDVPASLEAHASTARWVRGEAGQINAILKRNGNSQNSALQVTVEGAVLPVPMPSAA